MGSADVPRDAGQSLRAMRAVLKAYTISRGAAACVLKIRFGISLLTRRIQIDFGGNNGKLD